MPARPRLTGRTLSAVAAATAAAVARVALERRHLRTVARDPDYARLTRPHPRATVVGLLVLEQTGHMSPLQRPREIVEALRDLIDGVASTAGVAAV